MDQNTQPTSNAADEAPGYFYERAERQLALARTALDPRAAAAHYRLTGFYFDRHFSRGDSDLDGAATAERERIGRCNIAPRT